MNTLGDFQSLDGQRIDYDGKAAGELLRDLVGSGLLAAGHIEYAQILSTARSVVNVGSFDEEYGRYETFTWTIFAALDRYRSVSSESAKKAFATAIRELHLPILDPVIDIFVAPEATTEDWQSRLQVELAKTRKTVSTETLEAFQKVMAFRSSTKAIRAAFEAVGYKEGFSGYAGGDRRTVFNDFLVNIDQAREGESLRLAGVLWSMLETMHDDGASPEELRRVADRLERDGFRDERRSALFSATSATPPAANAADVTTPPTSLVDEMITFLRAVPRGVKELAREHRYGNRDYGFIVIKDEFDLQDFVRAYLRMRFPTVEPEDPIGKVAAVAGRVDFSLRGERIFIELKMIKRANQWKDEMYADVTSKIDRYSKDASCDHLIVFVYDPQTLLREAHAIEEQMTGERTVKLTKGSKREFAFSTHVVVEPHL